MWFWKLLAYGKALWLWKQYDHKNNQFTSETVVGVVVLAKYSKHLSCLVNRAYMQTTYEPYAQDFSVKLNVMLNCR